VFIQLEYNNTEVARVDPILEAYLVNGAPINYNYQDDAGQFLNNLIQRFEDFFEWQHIPNLIRRMFKPIFTERIHCPNCNYEYIEAKDDYIIHISVINHKSLSEGLDTYTEVKKVQKLCEKCNKNTTETRKFIKLPNTLIFRIHRNKSGGGDKKSLTEFKYLVDEDLDLSQYVEGEEKNTPSCIYRLVGVVINTGEILNAGHYFSYVREREYPSLSPSNVDVPSHSSSNLTSNSQLPTRLGNWI
jgi:ubiquitin C-terminal hydrolase